MSIDDVCQHDPSHVYEWKDKIVKEKYPNGLYFATCKNCGTDYRIPRFIFDYHQYFHPELIRE